MTARALSASTPSSGSGALGDWYDVTSATFGAVGDGTTDDTAAFQAAITAAKNSNGTVYVPGPHNYRITGVLDCSGNAWRMTGSGSGGYGPTLRMEGTATLHYGRTAASQVWELDHLNLVGLTGFTGNVVTIDSGSLADSQQFHIHDCNFMGDPAATNSLLYMNKVVIACIDNCRFDNTKVGIYNASTYYLNAVTIRDCVFAQSADAHIYLQSADIEMLRLRDLTFEGNATAIKCGTGCRMYKPVFDGLWVGDRAAGTAPIIDGISTQSGTHMGTIRDSMFFLGGGVNDVAIKFGASDSSNNCGPWVIEGCGFLGSGNAYDTYLLSNNYGTVREENNTYQAMTNVWKGGGNGLTTRRTGCPNATDITTPYTKTVATGSNFGETLSLASAGNVFGMQRGGASTSVTIPPNSSVAFPVGTEIVVFNEGSASVGTITVTAGAGVTYYGPANVPARGTGMLRLVKTATDTWFGQ